MGRIYRIGNVASDGLLEYRFLTEFSGYARFTRWFCQVMENGFEQDPRKDFLIDFLSFAITVATVCRALCVNLFKSCRSC